MRKVSRLPQSRNAFPRRRDTDTSLSESAAPGIGILDATENNTKTVPGIGIPDRKKRVRRGGTTQEENL